MSAERKTDKPTAQQRWWSRVVPGGAKRRVAGVRSQVRGRSDGPDAAAGGERRLLFILSTERSGSTLLSLALGAHERHLTPPEMHLLAYETFEQWRRAYPSAMLSLQFLLKACGSSDSDEAVEKLFAGARSQDVYRRILAERLPADALFIDKTPKYARDPAVLVRLEQLQPRYIWLVRHPLGVAASQIALRRQRSLAKASGSVARLKTRVASVREALSKRSVVAKEVRYWRDVNLNIEAFLAGVDSARWKRVNFEAFVRDPEPVLRQLCAWLGSEFRPAMLAPQEHIPREMRPELGDPKVYSHQRIDPAVADAWRAELAGYELDADTKLVLRRWGIDA